MHCVLAMNWNQFWSLQRHFNERYCENKWYMIPLLDWNHPFLSVCHLSLSSICVDVHTCTSTHTHTHIHIFFYCSHTHYFKIFYISNQLIKRTQRRMWRGIKWYILVFTAIFSGMYLKNMHWFDSVKRHCSCRICINQSPCF